MDFERPTLGCVDVCLHPDEEYFESGFGEFFDKRGSFITIVEIAVKHKGLLGFYNFIEFSVVNLLDRVEIVDVGGDETITDAWRAKRLCEFLCKLTLAATRDADHQYCMRST